APRHGHRDRRRPGPGGRRLPRHRPPARPSPAQPLPASLPLRRTRRGAMNQRFRTPALVVAAATLVAAAPAKLELTVDSIMRGPKLVGYPPTGLRWSGDSARLYFEWRRPGEAEPSTWVVAREGGAPRKLSASERRKAQQANGRWVAAHRRVLLA